MRSNEIKHQLNKSIYIAHVPCEYVRMRITNINWNHSRPGPRAHDPSAPGIENAIRIWKF